MLQKRRNNVSMSCPKFVSFNGRYIYLSACIYRDWKEYYDNVSACDVYMDTDEKLIRVEINPKGRYSISPNNKYDTSGAKVCVYNVRDCGLKRGIRYPVVMHDNYIEFKYGEENESRAN